MKKQYSVFFSVLFFLSLSAQLKAQAIAEIQGIGSMSNEKILSPAGGGGIRFAGYSPPINIVPPETYKGKSLPSKLCLRFGGDFYMSFMGTKDFNHVPLLSPETGTAQVNFETNMFGINASAKLSTSLFGGKVLPYVDGFIGYRGLISDMSIYPDDGSKSTYTTLSKAQGFNRGAAAGLLFRITDGVYLDAGTSWTHSEAGGRFIEMSSLSRVGDNIEYHARDASEDFLIFKLGITLYLSDLKDNNSGSSSSGSYSGSHSTYHSSCHSHSGGGHSHIGLIGR